ncbi:uncharacterized protein LOC142171774 [Nicotiana tabacum]|uniref:Uncharacterized protein LOC142171774 n=1 Tax=Nicotiana tabacum TaxID=4097 RepID=A0AC58T2X4_TOBAC
MEPISLSCASGTKQNMQVQVNVHVKTPIQTIHDLVTHNVALLVIDKTLMVQLYYADEGEDESTTGNFKNVAREANISPRASAKVGKKSEKQAQNKEASQPLRADQHAKRAQFSCHCIDGTISELKPHTKIWLFVDANVEGELIMDTAKHVTVNVFHHDIGQHVMMTSVYAKCTTLEWLDLWDNLYYLASDTEMPWMVGGDFKVILHEDEKIGCLLVYPPEYEDFAFCISSSGLFDLRYKESPFTWWNRRPNVECIFKRLDRTLHKLKNVNVALYKWSNVTFGDIFMQLSILEDIVKVKELLFEEEPTIANRINQFTKKGDPIDFAFLDNVPSMVTVEQNMELCRYLTLEEIKGAIFELSGDSVSGPDGFTGKFYQDCWEIIGFDIHNIEIVTDIRLRAKPANVMIKLDMAKAYDRVSWNQASGFFKSTRGVKQGDPLSPLLFMLSAEVLSRSLNKMFEDKDFIGFGMPKWSEPLNHLTYADDTIIFASTQPESLKKAVRDATGFARWEFSFTNLGCPIFYTRRSKYYYNDLIEKVKAKLHSWKRKLLSFGGEATLITSVLQSMPVHMLSMLDPTNNVIEHLHKMFERFFLSTNEEGRSRHWASWQKLCLPKEEVGLGFRYLHDVYRDLFAKLWWRFRTTKSLWSNFMCKKYCKK